MFRSYFILIAAALAAGQLVAQNTFTYAYQSAGTAATTVANGGTITFPAAAVGSSSAVTFVINNANSVQWTVTEATVTGSGFTTAGAAGIPVPANGTSAFLVTSTPKAEGLATGTLTVKLSGPNSQTATATFNLSATAIAGVLTSYVINPNGSQTLIANGGTILFPGTLVNATATASYAITNRSAAAVTLNSVLVSGAQFKVLGLPLLPTQIVVGAELRFTVTYTPVAASASTGTLVVTLNGAAQTYTLSGQGTSAVLSYEYITDAGSTPVGPGGTINVPAAAANTGQSQVLVSVRNTGNLASQIAGISTGNANFTLPDLPTMPVSLPPGGALTFTVAFSPKAVGTVTTSLTIGSSVFTLSGVGSGANLVVSLILGSQKQVLLAGGTAILPNTAVGNKLPLTFQVDNIGNQDASINALSVVGTNFAATQVPPLPVTVPAGKSIQIGAVFAPTSTGIVNGYIQIQEQAYGFRVAADPPPALPAITFTNITSTMNPLSQPAVGLTFATPYPYDLNGILSLTFTTAALGDDPNIQFISGARFISFKIPANSTQAVFSNGATTAPFQVGTTAGDVTLGATFALGTYDFTSGGPITRTINIAAAPPVIRAVQINSQTASSVTLLITGYSTPRAVSQLILEFTPATGATLETTKLTADVAKAFDTWFQSTAGMSFGSQFALTVQLNVTGNLSAIQSIAVSASNAVGTSTPTSLSLN